MGSQLSVVMKDWMNIAVFYLDYLLFVVDRHAILKNVLFYLLHLFTSFLRIVDLLMKFVVFNLSFGRQDHLYEGVHIRSRVLDIGPSLTSLQHHLVVGCSGWGFPKGWGLVDRRLLRGRPRRDIHPLLERKRAVVLALRGGFSEWVRSRNDVGALRPQDGSGLIFIERFLQEFLRKDLSLRLFIMISLESVGALDPLFLLFPIESQTLMDHVSPLMGLGGALDLILIHLAWVLVLLYCQDVGWVGSRIILLTFLG